MAEVTTHRFEKRSHADTASGQSVLPGPSVGFSVISDWTTMNTLSDTPIWTSYVIVGREASMTATHILKEISSGDRKVVFDRGLRLAVTIEWDGDLCLASDERFGLYGSGHSQEEAISDYSEFFVEFYSDIVNTPNRELPPSTQSLKRTLKTFGRLEKRV